MSYPPMIPRRVPRTATDVINGRFLQSRRSEYAYWGRSERPLMAGSSRPLTVNMQGSAYLEELEIGDR